MHVVSGKIGRHLQDCPHVDAPSGLVKQTFDVRPPTLTEAPDWLVYN